DTPPASTAGQMGELLTIAERTRRRLSVLPTRRDGCEFRNALQIVRSELLGPIYSARNVSWGKAVPDESDSDVDPFAIFAYHFVDQALQLIRRPPRQVFGRILDCARAQKEPSATTFTLVIGFEPGVDALIDVNLESGAIHQTGWILAGSRGGFSGGRIYLQEPS